MEIWQSLARTGIEELPELALRAEALGFTGVAVSDHLVRPVEIRSPYPYSPDGKPVSTTETPYADPWGLIAYLAALTTRLRFMPSVFVLPARDPFSVAKSLATACVLSRNRVMMGIGVGWMAEEFAMTGQSFFNRGKRTDEMVEVIKKLMTGEPVEHHGAFYDFPMVTMTPAPSVMPSFLVGGDSPAALARAARMDGWIGVAYEQDRVASILAELVAARRKAGTLGRTFQAITAILGKVGLEDCAAIERIGLTGLMLPPLLGATTAEKMQELERRATMYRLSPLI